MVVNILVCIVLKDLSNSLIIKPFGWSKQERIVNALLIEWDKDVAERVTVALIHHTAWEEVCPQRKYIRLARVMVG